MLESVILRAKPAHIERLSVVLVVLVHALRTAALAWLRRELSASLVDVRVASSVGGKALLW